MSPRLSLQVAGGGPPVELPQAGVLSIGSGERADLRLAGAGVADVHCAIGRVKGGGFALKDLGSAQGTLVNGRPVQQARLEAGDEIAVGAARLTVVDPAAPAPAPERAPAQPPESVPALKGYRIEKRLGRGGMGAVFLAVQESLERRVALKVLSSRLAADGDFVRRFQAEARAAAALSHPNVVTVHDVWEESGHHWLAMEYMERGNLEDRVAREGRLPPAEVLAVLIDAARGLVFAELRGIVHRDIKPANLMQEGLGHTKIADLGLATHLEAEVAAAGDTRVFGTPHFISPEQARGEAVDGRSDLYSLGATAYRLLSGRTPFEGATTRDILRGHLSEPVRPLRALVPDVPPALEAVVLRLLQKDPAARFPSAAALLEELERQRAGLITAAGGGGARRGRWWLAAAAAAALAAGWFALGPRTGKARTGDAGRVSAAAPRAGGAQAAGRAPGPLLGGPLEPPASGAPSAEERIEAPLDDDSALKALEREARDAYAELPAALGSAERRARLEELCAAYPGTTAARRFREELAELPAEAADSGGPGDPGAEDRPAAAGRSALEAIARADADGRRPLGALLEHLRALCEPATIDPDPVAAAARARALSAVLAARVAEAERTLAEVDALAAAGRFEDLDVRLATLAARLATEAPGTPSTAGAGPPEPGAAPTAPGSAPAVPELPPVPELGRLAELRAAALARRAGLPAERAAWALARERAAAGALAAALRPTGPVGGPLARLDLAAAGGALEQLGATLGEGDAARCARSLRTDLGRAQAALAGLAAAFPAGAWRRKSILDPRAGGRGTLTVIGTDAAGLRVAGDGDGTHLGWGAFAAAPGALDQLFHQRLERDYTPEELDGIAALVRLAAVRAAAGLLRGRLGGDAAPLSEEERAALLAAFEQARPWCVSERDQRALESERSALLLLVSALDAGARGAWSSAVADTERLLSEHRDALLVRLLSDGPTGLAAPAAGDPGR